MPLDELRDALARLPAFFFVFSDEAGGLVG